MPSETAAFGKSRRRRGHVGVGLCRPGPDKLRARNLNPHCVRNLANASDVGAAVEYGVQCTHITFTAAYSRIAADLRHQRAPRRSRGCQCARGRIHFAGSTAIASISINAPSRASF
jgi:hypothetical protein